MRDTSFALIPSLITLNTPRQLKWHMDAAVRMGATKEEVRAITQIVLDICVEVGAPFPGTIPTLD